MYRKLWKERDPFCWGRVGLELSDQALDDGIRIDPGENEGNQLGDVCDRWEVNDGLDVLHDAAKSLLLGLAEITDGSKIIFPWPLEEQKTIVGEVGVVCFWESKAVFERMVAVLTDTIAINVEIEEGPVLTHGRNDQRGPSISESVVADVELLQA